jgi:dihydrofolate reductase
MRKVILKMHVSLDGYMRGNGEDSLDWVFRTYDEQLKTWEVDSLWQAGTHIMGRTLYSEMADYWPASTEEYAEPMNTIPKVVFSKTLTRTDWYNTRIARGDLGDEIVRLKQESGKDILLHGGIALSHALTKLKLIDEYRLIVHPVIISKGFPLFPDPIDLQLLDSLVFPSGSLLLVYNRV